MSERGKKTGLSRRGRNAFSRPIVVKSEIHGIIYEEETIIPFWQGKTMRELILDGHHIQFNVVDAATLWAAQQHPEQYRDLIARVAGYSDYFCDLSKALQDEIIARTEHQSL